MSLVDFVRKQFIDVIDWVESEPGVLAFRYPMQDREIQSGAMLTVRESQLAAFVNEGKLADVFKPGLYRLTTNTLPILTYLRNWDKAFQSPFKSDVFFFTQRDQLDQKWGTAQPITIRDKEYGALRVRGFGNYSYRIADVEPFYRRLSGTFERYTVAELEGQLRARILTEISTFLGAGDVAFVDMAANQHEFSERLKKVLEAPFADFGLELRSFQVESLSLPEELQQRLDKASSMRLVGDLRAYTQFQAAEAIPAAAANPGGVAGAGAGLGVGVALGQAMAGQMLAPPGNAGTPAADAGTDPIAQLERLHDLVAKGVLTQAEFDTKKAELLGKIR